MYLNHRHDAALWKAAMDRDNAIAFAALAFGADDLGSNPIPDDDHVSVNEFGLPLHRNCQHGAEAYCRWCDTPDPWEDDCA